MTTQSSYEKKLQSLLRRAKKLVRVHRGFDYPTIVCNSVALLSHYYPLYGQGELLYAVLSAIEYEQSFSQEMRNRAISEQPYVIRMEKKLWREITLERDIKNQTFKN